MLILLCNQSSVLCRKQMWRSSLRHFALLVKVMGKATEVSRHKKCAREFRTELQAWPSTVLVPHAHDLTAMWCLVAR